MEPVSTVELALTDCADDMLDKRLELSWSEAGFELEIAISVLNVSL